MAFDPWSGLPPIGVPQPRRPAWMLNDDLAQQGRFFRSVNQPPAPAPAPAVVPSMGPFPTFDAGIDMGVGLSAPGMFSPELPPMASPPPPQFVPPTTPPLPQPTPMAQAAEGTAQAAQAADATGGRRAIPADLYTLIEREAKARNIPLNYAMALFGVESGFRPDARNPQSTATGVGQILASTATNPGYGVAPISEEDRLDPTKAVPFSMDYLQKKAETILGGPMDWSNPNHRAIAFRAYGENNPDYVRKIEGAAGGEFTPDGTATDSPAQAERTPGWQQGVDPIRQAIIDGVLRPGDRSDAFKDVPAPDSTQSLMLGIASGLLQGPNVGAGLGKGIEMGLGAMGRDNTNAIARARALAEVRGDKPANLLALGRLLQGDTRLDQHGVQLQQADERIAQARRNEILRLQGLNIQGDALRERMRQFDQKYDPTQAASLEGARVGAREEAQMGTKAWADLMNSSEADYSALADINSAFEQMKSNPDYFGATPVNRISRFLNQMGLSGDPNDVDAIRKMTAQARNEYLTQLTGGHVGGIRSNAELQNLSAAMADITTSPKAAEWILQMRKNVAERNIEWRRRVVEMDSEGAPLRGRDYINARKRFEDEWHKSHPLPEYRPGQGSTQTQLPRPGTGRTSTGVTFTIND